MAARGIVPERGSYDLLPGTGPGATQGQGRLAHRPGGDTLLHIYTAGGKAPKETIDELEERFRPDAATTSHGHGLGIKERDYDNIIQGWEVRGNPQRGGSNVPVNGVPHGSTQTGNQGKGRLARDAQMVRHLSQRGKQAAKSRDGLDSSLPSSG